MTDLTRQQLCAALSISESTCYRLEQAGLPCTPIGKRGKRYNLPEIKNWLRENQGCLSTGIKQGARTSPSWSQGAAFTDACRKAHLRVMPSS